MSAWSDRETHHRLCHRRMPRAAELNPTATVAVLVAASAAAASTAERSFRLDSHRRSGASISGSEPRSSLLWREMCCGAPQPRLKRR